MKRILSFALALASILCLVTFCVSAADGTAPVLQDIDYDEYVGRISQSDSGFTAQSTYIYSGGRTSMVPRNDTGFQFYYLGLENWSAGRGYEDAPLDGWYLDFLTATLENLRANGGACIIRGTYGLDGERNGEPDTIEVLHLHQKQLTEVFNKYPDVVVAVECGMVGAFGEMWGGKYSRSADKAAVLDTWLKELDECIAVSVRTIEEYLYYVQHSSVYQDKYKNQTVKGVQYPALITRDNYYKFAFEDEDFGRIGMYNDAMIQDGNDGGSFSGGTRDSFRQFFQNRAKRAIYGGEFSGAAVFRYSGNEILTAAPTIWMPLNAIPEFYMTNLTYYHGGNRAYEVTGKFKYSHTFTNVRFNSEEARDQQIERIRDTYEKYGCDIPVSFNNLRESGGVYYVDITTGGWSNAVVNNDLIDAIGKSTSLTADLSAYLGESVASFFEDHLGYRIVLKESYITGSVARGGTISVKGVVDNTGFSGIIRDKLTELVITNGTDTYTVPTNIDVSAWECGTRNPYAANIKLPGNIPAGEYQVFMRIASQTNDGNTNAAGGVRFANAGQYSYTSVSTGAVTESNRKHSIIYNSAIGGNYIGKFAVTDEVTQGSDDTICQQLTVTFVDDADGELAKFTVNYGDSVTAPAAPEKASTVEECFVFDKWVDADGNEIDLTRIVADMVVKPIYIANPQGHTVTFLAEDGTEIDKIVVNHGDAVTAPAAPEKPAPEGKRFILDQWVDADGNEVDLIRIMNDITVKVTYLEVPAEITVNFDVGDGKGPYPITVEYGEDVPPMAHPTKYTAQFTKYTFDKWVDADGNDADLTAVKADMTVYALYIVSFDPMNAVDLMPDAWYMSQGVMQFGLMNGLIKGMDDKGEIVAPDATMTRAQFATILYRMQGQPSVDGMDDPTLPDYDAAAWWADAMKWAVGSGIINGNNINGNILMDADGKVSRLQMVTMVYRYADKVCNYDMGEIAEPDFTAYEDGNGVNYSQSEMMWAIGAEYVKGTQAQDKTYLTPNNNITRAQAMAILMRFMQDEHAEKTVAE